jgi:HTH-type transcriptional regulator / antitoxin MqsA
MANKIENSCPLCGEKCSSKLLDEIIQYKGKKKTIPNLTVNICKGCGEEFFKSSSEKEIDREFADLRRSVERLLTSHEIKSLRKKHGFSQQRLSELLGMAPKTIARYELGTVVQSKSVDILLRLLLFMDANINFLQAHEKDKVNRAY